MSHAQAVLSLLERDPDLLRQCIEHPEERLETKSRVVKEVPGATIEDIDAAVEQYLANETASRAAQVKNDGMQFRKLQQGLQDGLLEVVRQIDRGYRITMWMYTIAFGVGITMLLTSTVTAFMHDVQRTAVLGGLGAADVIAFLIFKPAQELQSSRGSLAQLQAAFFAWINDIHNWNDYLDQLEKDSKGAAAPFDKVKEISAIQTHTTEQMVQLISNFTKVSEPVRRRSSRHREGQSDSHAKGTATKESSS